MLQPNAGGIASVAPQPTQQAMPAQGMPMPGQANPQAIQGVLQQGQGAGPAPQGGGISAPLSQVPVNVLQAAALGQVQAILPYQAISELQERLKSQKMQQAIQGQAAMAAGAQQAQQPPVAQQILAESQQLDQGIGAAPYGFADGGIVAFSGGGSSWIDSLPEGSAARYIRDWIERGRPAMEKPLIDRLVESIKGAFGRDQEPKLSPEYSIPNLPPIPIPEVEVSNAPPPTQRPPASPPGTASARERVSASASSRMPGPAEGMAAMGLKPPSAQDIYGGVNKELESTIGELGLRKNISPEEQRLREILARQSQQNIEARRGDIAASRQEAEEARAKGTAQRSLFDDAEALLGLAGSIDTRKGKAIGSLAQGMSGAMKERRLSREAAEKDYRQFLREERAANDALRQIEMLETQRQLAVQSGDRQRVEAIDDKITALKGQMAQNKVNAENTAFGHQVKMQELANAGEDVKSRRMQAEAARTSAAAQASRADRVGASGKPLLTAKDILAYQAKARARVEESVTKGSEFAAYRKMSPQEQAAYKERRVREELGNELRNIRDLGLYEVPEEFLRSSTPASTPAATGAIKWDAIPK